MRKIIANKIFLITSLALIVFASFSVFIVNFLNNRMVGENVKAFAESYKTTLSEIVELNEETVDKIIYGIHGDILRMTIALENGKVITDNVKEGQKLVNIAEDQSFISAITPDIKEPKVFFASNSNGEQFGTVACSVKINMPVNFNGIKAENFVVRIAMTINYDSSYFILMIPIIIIAVIITMCLSYIFIGNSVKEAINPLIAIRKNLTDINNGDYEQINVTSKYRDVQQLIDEVNIASIKISKSVQFLNYEQSKINFIMDHMTQGIIALSLSGNVIITNREALSIFGASTNLLGSGIESLIKDEILVDKIKEIMQNNECDCFEYEILGKYYRINVEYISEKWYNDQNSVLMLITLDDITQEILSAQIRSEFFANASHELRTPLTAIKGFSELLPIVSVGEGKDKCIEEINKNTNKMLSLINDMLNLAKIDANVSEENFEVIDLELLVKEVINKIDSIAIKKNIAVTFDGKGEIFGNAKQIEEVFTNLIDNAIKYNNDNGYVAVEIKNTNNEVVVTVKDNGIGIDNVHLSRIFERFYRVDKGRVRKVESTGLGLSIVKHIVGSHKGKISVQSKLNKGTTFILSFPKINMIE